MLRKGSFHVAIDVPAGTDQRGTAGKSTDRKEQTSRTKFLKVVISGYLFILSDSV